MNLKNICLLPLLVAVAVATSSCRSSRSAQAEQAGAGTPPAAVKAETTPAKAVASAAVKRAVNAVQANAQTAHAVTARVKFKLESGGKSLSSGGTLRMRRGEVIQLSLTFLGMEVGRLECTPEGILLVDRMNKQYVRAAYSEAAPLTKAGLGFSSLEAIFWNAIFLPKGQNPSLHPEFFTLKRQGTKNILGIANSTPLTYAFTADSGNGQLESTKISGQAEGTTAAFECAYSDFEPLDGKEFPTTLRLTLTSSGKKATVTLNLSKLNNNADWNGRTEVSSKYNRLDAGELLKKIIGK